MNSYFQRHAARCFCNWTTPRRRSTGEVTENTTRRAGPSGLVTPAPLDRRRRTGTGQRNVSTTSFAQFSSVGMGETSQGRVQTESASRSNSRRDLQQSLSPTVGAGGASCRKSPSQDIFSSTKAKVRGGDHDGTRESIHACPGRSGEPDHPSRRKLHAGRPGSAGHTIDFDFRRQDKQGALVFQLQARGETYPTQGGSHGSQRYFYSRKDGSLLRRRHMTERGVG